MTYRKLHWNYHLPMCTVLATVLSSLVGKTEHYVRNFAKEEQKLKIAPEEELKAYDVSDLFTSFPVDRLLVIIKLKTDSQMMSPLKTEHLFHQR